MKKLLASLLLLCVTTYALWPYYEVWRLERAVVRSDRVELARCVDLDAVREAIKQRLNKDLTSSVGDVSNAFVHWLQDGIHRMGSAAVDRLVNLDWVRQLLLSKASPKGPAGFVSHITYAFFDGPAGFLVRIGELGEDPVYLRLSLTLEGWRVTALYD